MRKAIITSTIAAFAVLAVAVAAFAADAVNTYTATLKVSPKAVGTAKAPVNVSFLTTLAAAGTGGNRAAPLTDIKQTIYGLKSNGKSFPTCSITTIETAKNDTGCPKGALVAQGPVKALLGPANDGTSAGSPCNPYLHIWNAGQGKLIDFFVIIPPNNTCGSLSTGASAPFPATIKQVGKNMVIDTPLPPDVSTKAGNLTGVYSSLITETVTYGKLSTKVKGKTVGYFQSIGCSSGKRPNSTAVTAVDFTGASSTSTVTGTDTC